MTVALESYDKMRFTVSQRLGVFVLVFVGRVDQHNVGTIVTQFGCHLHKAILTVRSRTRRLCL